MVKHESASNDEPSPPPETTLHDSSPEPRPDPGILESIIEETLHSEAIERTFAHGEPREDAEDHGALLQVAKKYASESVDQPPVVTELVVAILKPRFPSAEVSQAWFHEMSREIAQSLLDSESATQRLRRLWVLLQEKNR